MIRCNYVKPLQSESLIDDFEKFIGYRLPAAFRAFAKTCNGGRPERRSFATRSGISRELKSFLSFNPGDRETVQKVYGWCGESLTNRYVAFACDNFGNLICFDMRDSSVVFWDHETGAIDAVADDFTAFLDLLH